MRRMRLRRNRRPGKRGPGPTDVAARASVLPCYHISSIITYPPCPFISSPILEINAPVSVPRAFDSIPADPTCYTRKKGRLRRANGRKGAEVEWEDWRTPCPCTGSRWRAHTGVLDPPTTVHSKLLCTPQHVVTARFPLICQPLWYSSDAPGFRYASATLTSVILRLTDGMEGIYTVPYGVCNMIDESIERVAYKLRHMSNGTAHHPDGTRKSPLIKGLLNTVRSMMHPLTNCFKLQ